MTKLVANPFFVYILAFFLVILVYSLGWSELYPSLSPSLIVFFLVTFVISFFCGAFIHSSKRIHYQAIGWKSNTTVFVLLVCLGYLAEFYYNGGIPFLLILHGNTEYDYRMFGIPTFHVLLVTFNSFLSVYLFHQLLSNYNKKRLFLFLLSLVPAVLIINRGMLVIILTSCLFVYVLSLEKLRIKAFLLISVSILIVFFFFGVMGNFRQNKGTSVSSEQILEMSMATEEFKNSIVPKEYIWSYLYISSPLANLQHTINNSALTDSWLAFANYELLPDFISKRTGELLEEGSQSPPLIAGWLTVGTMYARPYFYVGWLGMIQMFGFFALTSLVYLFALKKRSRYFISGLAILNTVALFNTFDNMYSFSGLVVQLIYPIVFSALTFRKIEQE